MKDIPVTRARRRAWDICLLLVLIPNSVLANSSERAIGQFVHTAWSAKDSAPANISAMAQTTDGFLWLGTRQGLYRFDGATFERYEPESGAPFPSDTIVSLLALPDGDLWIGFREGVSRLRGGQNTSYTLVDQGLLKNVRTLVEDHDGVIWAVTNGGLFRFERDRWRRVPEDWGYPSDKVRTIYVDRRGTLWVVVTDTILFLPPGARKFQSTGIKVGVVLQLAESPSGTLWMAETSRSVRPIPLVENTHGPKSEIEVGSNAILFDNDGSLWITSLGDGMRRVPSPDNLNGRKIGEFSPAIERFTKKDGLTSDYSVHILKDREGSIWVATSAGLDQFRRGAFVPIYLPARFERKVLVAGANGSVWVASLSGGHAWINGNSWTSANLYEATPYGVADSRGLTLLSIEPPGPRILRLENGKLTVLAPAPPGVEVWGLGNVMAQDRVGTIWLVTGPEHLSFLKNGKWEQLERPRETAGQRAWVSFTDEEGRVWFGFANSILLLDHGKLRTFTPQDGVKGAVYAITGHHGHIWIGGPDGLAVLQEDHFRAVAPAEGTSFYVTGVQETADGDLFVSEPQGVAYVPAAEVSQVFRSGSAAVHYQIFDQRDGLPGPIQLGDGYPGCVQSTDGRLWFAAAGGVAWINPTQILRNLLPPPVTIRSITANRTRYASSPRLKLPPQTRDLLIDYTALSLAIPERVRFRYKLEGYDANWQDADTRREAAYTNLPPGHYRFRVIACNNDGVWNETGASLDFSLLPAWYQTIWFRSGCVLAFAIFLWTVYQFRLRQLERQYSARMEERIGERTRIARELHDTLLQSLHGLMFQYQAARNLLARKPEDAMHALDEAISGTEQAIAESRDAIQDLRPESIVQYNLEQQLKTVAEGLSAAQGPNQKPPSFHVIVEGEPGVLSPKIQHEVYNVSREVIRNAFRHANARSIEVEIRYDKTQLRLRLRDDGKGIDPKVLEESRRPGHWGLPGVRERAQRIGARLDFWSQSGAGTEVELTVPAVIAYESSSNTPRFKLFRRIGNREQSS